MAFIKISISLSLDFMNQNRMILAWIFFFNQVYVNLHVFSVIILARIMSNSSGYHVIIKQVHLRGGCKANLC
jgi:hypothetical protein